MQCHSKFKWEISNKLILRIAHYFFNDMINIKDFDSSLLEIDKKSYKKIGIYNIRYITIKIIDDYEYINSINPLHLITGKADGYMEENNENKYLVSTSTNGNKIVPAKFTKLWDEIKHLIETITEGKKGKCDKDFMKIKFDSDDKFILKKMLKIHMLIVIVRSVFKDSKYYPQVFLDECLYEV